MNYPYDLGSLVQRNGAIPWPQPAAPGGLSAADIQKIQQFPKEMFMGYHNEEYTPWPFAQPGGGGTPQMPPQANQGVPDLMLARGQGLQTAMAAPGRAAQAPGMQQAMANNPVNTAPEVNRRGSPGAAVGQLGDADALRRLQMMRQMSAMGGLGQIARTRYGP